MASFDFISKLNESINNLEKEEGILTTEEVELLIISFAKSRASEGFSEDELFKIIEWAEGQRIGNSLLELTLKGFVDINWVNSEPTFKMTDMGRSVFEEEKKNDLAN